MKMMRMHPRLLNILEEDTARCTGFPASVRRRYVKK